MLPAESMEEFKRPARSPWLLLGVVVVLVAVVFGVRAGCVGYARMKVKRAEAAAQAASEQPAATAAPEAVVESATAPSVPASPAAAALLAEAAALEKAGDLVGARTKYLALLAAATDAKTRDIAEKGLGAVNPALYISTLPAPEKIDYVVRKGDSLARIAKRLGTTVELITKNNTIARPDRIQAGDRVRVVTGRFAVAVSKKRNDLVLTLNGQFFKRYAVSCGKDNKTPVGTFVINDKIVEPPWWRPDGKVVPYGDKENILGTRWMSIKATGQTPDAKGYGIHGTWDEASIGKSESAGCVRMRNPEVEEAFILLPIGTPVTITDD